MNVAAAFGLCLLLSLAPPQGASIAAEPLRDAAPAGIAASIRPLLAPGVRARVGATVLDFWFVKSLPVKPDSGWGAVREGALVGAVVISSEFRDIRGRLIKPGVYTLRYGLQPQNGDHLGVSPFREFLLLIPAPLDQDPADREQEATIDLSTKAVGGSHPAVWSIDPPVTSAAPMSTHKTELGHQALVVEVGGTHFGIVLIGRIDA